MFLDLNVLYFYEFLNFKQLPNMHDLNLASMVCSKLEHINKYGIQVAVVPVTFAKIKVTQPPYPHYVDIRWL